MGREPVGRWWDRVKVWGHVLDTNRIALRNVRVASPSDESPSCPSREVWGMVGDVGNLYTGHGQGRRESYVYR